MAFENQSPDPQEKAPSVDMEAFRAEIKELADERKRQKADKVVTGLNMIELVDVDPAELTEKDAVMWQKVKNFEKGLLPKEELDLPSYIKDIRSSGAKISRTSFLQVIANIIQKKADYFE